MMPTITRNTETIGCRRNCASSSIQSSALHGHFPGHKRHRFRRARPGAFDDGAPGRPRILGQLRVDREPFAAGFDLAFIATCSVLFVVGELHVVQQAAFGLTNLTANPVQCQSGIEQRRASTA